MHAKTKYPWYVRFIFWRQRKKYGKVLESARIWARSPRIFLALSWLFTSIDRRNSPISPALRSLIIVRVSQLNGCSFCIDLNSLVLLERGISMKKLQALSEWSVSDLFEAKEKISLEYVEAVTSSKGGIDKDLKKRLETFYNEDEIVEITALIAFQNMSTKFNNAFDVQPQGFCRLG